MRVADTSRLRVQISDDNAPSSPVRPPAPYGTTWTVTFGRRDTSAGAHHPRRRIPAEDGTGMVTVSHRPR